MAGRTAVRAGGGKGGLAASSGDREERGEMTSIKEAATAFLAHKRIAVTGVSRTPKGHGSNVVYQRLRQRGYDVFAINPNANQVEGDPCYPNLASVPGGVEAVVVGTRPELADETMRECAELGITHVWMHRAFGEGSVSDAATEFGRTNGITVIDGGCPLMFEPTADPGHKVMRFVFTMTGKVPRTCEAPRVVQGS
jgi:predicted CoA-binding protein